MGRSTKITSEPNRRRARATTPEARINQIAADAYDLAERQIRDGTASSQVITHFLKAGSEREKLENERLRQEVAMLRAKEKQMASQQNMEEVYKQALAAMRSYSGQVDDD